ncbi:hypothetical protein A8B75_13480 [Sphingomonadales bacterium EhC05]|nr:hypothetical protein A8B75_13480 [Sphingomonadales bacterium EhC05]
MSIEDHQPSTPYDVGYKKPPQQHQFKKGESGNPKGRPKKSLKPDIPDDFQELIASALLEPVMVKKNGKQCEMTKGKMLVQQLVNDAISGPASVRVQIFKMLDAMGISQKAEERFDQKLAALADQDLWTPEMEKTLEGIEAKFIEEDDETGDTIGE